jgi:hypothetical protein
VSENQININMSDQQLKIPKLVRYDESCNYPNSDLEPVPLQRRQTDPLDISPDEEGIHKDEVHLDSSEVCCGAEVVVTNVPDLVVAPAE